MRENPADKRHLSDLLRKRFGLEHKLVGEFEAVIVSDLQALNKWDVVDQERDAVWKLLRSAGALEGAAAMAVTFFCLNRVPRYLARHAARKQRQAENPYTLEKPANKAHQSPFQTPNIKTLEQQVNQSRRRFMFTAMELTFDIGMSLGVGASVALIASNEKEAERIFVEIPLQSGSSLVSDKVCNNLLEEYQRQWRKTADNREVLQEPHHRALQIIKGLAQNCRHRQVMEHQLRENQGLSSTASVSIPDTGVMPMSEDPLLVMMLEDIGDDNDALEASSASGFPGQGVASLVQDQEEQ